MKKAIVLTIHDNEAKMLKAVGTCAICDEVVYFSGRGISGEIGVEELKKIPNPRFIGRECLIELAEAISHIMRLPYGMREEIKDGALKEVEHD